MGRYLSVEVILRADWSEPLKSKWREESESIHQLSECKAAENPTIPEPLLRAQADHPSEGSRFEGAKLLRVHYLSKVSVEGSGFV